MRLKAPPSVALLIESSNAYARGLLAGIVRFIQEQQRPWSIHLSEQGRGGTPPPWLADWRVDGIIARIETQRIAQAVLRCKVPVVDVSAARHIPKVSWVETDDDAIARLAAEHLLSRGFRHLAFCGEPGFNWSRWRADGFARHVAKAGIEVQSFSVARRGRHSESRARRLLAQWLLALPKPVGIMACYDIKAQEVLDVCRELRLNVPEQVAVIGVDNDELLCNLSYPPLSSVIPDAERTGYEAAQLLERLMRGERILPRAHLLEPLGIATRRSTDILAIDDEDVAAAMRYLRAHACEGINVQDVLREIPISRRVLERRFRQIVGRTPHEELLRLRLERVKQLLLETDLNLATIAERSGFRHVEYLSFAFKRHVGQSPSHFRKVHRRR